MSIAIPLTGCVGAFILALLIWSIYGEAAAMAFVIGAIFGSVIGWMTGLTDGRK